MPRQLFFLGIQSKTSPKEPIPSIYTALLRARLGSLQPAPIILTSFTLGLWHSWLQADAQIIPAPILPLLPPTAVAQKSWHSLSPVVTIFGPKCPGLKGFFFPGALLALH